MKNSILTLILSVILVVIIIALVAGAIYFYQPKRIYLPNNDNQSTNQPVAINPESPTNREIKNAFQDFWDFTQSNKSIRSEALCKGGFINTDNQPELISISNKIIKNRIINSNPLEYAKTQDEAGITCLASFDKWVLFAPLNGDSTNVGKNYYCLDSTGKSGQTYFDNQNIKCTQ